MSGGCKCGETVKFEGLSADYKRRLWAVILINASMFAIEMTAGYLSQSQALKADALDFFGDTVTYGLSLFVIGRPVRTRSLAAIGKGLSLSVMGLWILATTLYQVLILGLPRAEIMGAIGVLAFFANIVSVLLLVKYRDGDANVRSVWLCSRNDAIGNLAVIVAALGVWGTATAWPDLIVAGIMAGLFLYSSMHILRQALREYEDGNVFGSNPHV